VHANKLSALLVAGIPLVYAACGGDSLTLPSEGEPAHITVLRGSGQSGRVQTELGLPLVVKVTDTQDRPVAGATVNFVFDDVTAGGSAAPPTTTTDANGEASSTITLGTRVGPMTGHAEVPVPQGTVPVTTPFTVMATSADANGIAVFSGDGQNGLVGATLPDPLVVQVTDNFGNPIPGIPIAWSVDGGGTVSEASSQTDGNGRASVQRTLGNTAGEQRTLATATGLAGSPATFIHQASAGNASRVAIVSGNNQTAPAGTELGAPLVVEVLDANDNPIVGADVTWVVGAGDGSVDPQTNETDGNGRSSVRWTLGAEPGNNTVSAVVSGVGIARFNATGGKAGSTTRITSIEPGTSTVGQAVTVSVTVTGSGGTPTGSVTVNGESVAQPCTITLSNGSGSCSISFTAGGTHRVTATYAGDARFGGSSDDDNHRVNENVRPIAEFVHQCVNLDCAFEDRSHDSDGNIVSWSWDFGDGQGSNQQNPPEHSYSQAGTYNVTLTVTDNGGASGSVTVPVEVAAANSAPTAAFAAPQDCTALAECQFNDGSSDSDGSIVAWDWNFGDLTPHSDQQNPAHTFPAPGNYNVTLTVTDNLNATDDHTEVVTIGP
jgi:PKD repeat protein